MKRLVLFLLFVLMFSAFDASIGHLHYTYGLHLKFSEDNKDNEALAVFRRGYDALPRDPEDCLLPVRSKLCRVIAESYAETGNHLEGRM
jgi:hypothetical protein